MKFSFVIPAHNEERYLRECLNSIFRELHGKSHAYEIIVVNNASTDETETIAKSYPGVVVIGEPQKGLVKARQAGYLKASGELIANIDADTRLKPGWLEIVMEEFLDNEELVALSGPYIYYDLSKGKNFLVKSFYALGFIIYLFNRRILRIGSMIQGGNFVVRRAALERIGGYDTGIDFYGEDTNLARRLYEIGDVKFVFCLTAYSSGRRLAGEGVMKMGVRYALNYFWETFFKRPFTRTSIDIR